MNKRKYQKPRIWAITCDETPILSGSEDRNGPGGAKQQPFENNIWDESSENTEENPWSKDEDK